VKPLPIAEIKGRDDERVRAKISEIMLPGEK
jgi:hypothetical protein